MIFLKFQHVIVNLSPNIFDISFFFLKNKRSIPSENYSFHKGTVSSVLEQFISVHAAKDHFFSLFHIKRKALGEIVFLSSRWYTAEGSVEEWDKKKKSTGVEATFSWRRNRVANSGGYRVTESKEGLYCLATLREKDGWG